MPTPSSGEIGFYNINMEVNSGAPTAPRDMAWVKANTKDAISNLNSARNRSYFQLNGAARTSFAWSDNRKGKVSTCNCSNCVLAQCRDARAWLQTNCNCNCSGNCNCQCNCANK